MKKKTNRLDLLWWYWFYLINGNSAVCTGTTTIHFFLLFFLQWNQKEIGWFGPKCALMDVRYGKKEAKLSSEILMHRWHPCTKFVFCMYLAFIFFLSLVFSPSLFAIHFRQFYLSLVLFFSEYIPTNFKGFNVSTIWRTAW